MVARYTRADHCGHGMHCFYITLLYFISIAKYEDPVSSYGRCAHYIVLSRPRRTEEHRPTWEVHYSRLAGPAEATRN